jgi:phytoene desaturase
MSKIAVIGSGFSGLSAATFLAKAGMDVTVYEKNDSPGGRARKYSAKGYTFDMGPSWYWMPDVFEAYFQSFGKNVSDYYDLIRLDPSYRVYFGESDAMDLPASLNKVFELFESLEKGSSENLKKFLDEAAYKYQVGMNDLVYKPGLSITELMDSRLVKGVFKLHVFQSISTYIRKYFQHPRLIQLLEFPVLFLGAMPAKTPALYSLMNYADISLGTWYPKGGMHKIIEGMVSLATEQGVKFEFNANVDQIAMNSTKAKGLMINGEFQEANYIVGGGDYHHIEQTLLPKEFRRYDEKYWDSRVMAPGSLIFYVGVNKKLQHLLHHNLFFDEDFTAHATEIYEDPQWPSKPLFYVCCTSKSDTDCAPEGHENLFILIPVAPGLEDKEEIRSRYFNLVIDRMERLTGEKFKQNIDYHRSYAHKDFIRDYNSYKGNAYGLANTLMQTANLKPSMINKKVPNLFYTGQLTVPGPGVPPSLISGQVVAQQVLKSIKR